MDPVTLKYVNHQRVYDYLKLGWMIDGLLPGHHAYWAVAMIWPCQCPIQLPENKHEQPT